MSPSTQRLNPTQHDLLPHEPEVVPQEMLQDFAPAPEVQLVPWLRRDYWSSYLPYSWFRSDKRSIS